MLEKLSPDQEYALNMMLSGENVFLTGGAGSGKSHLIRAFKNQISIKEFPILASTGSAAVLLGGRTFHSFFGLGIMEGGSEATYQRMRNDQRIAKRLRQIEGFVLDEVSMISGEALNLAEKMACEARQSSLPWGGLRVIAVGDFAQLPPVTKTQKRDWAFLSHAWQVSDFQVQHLQHNHRVQDGEFLDSLNSIREGKLTKQVVEFLDSRMRPHDPDDDAPRLFARRDQAENFNCDELAKIDSDEVVVDSIFIGEKRYVEVLQNTSPVPQQIRLKKACRVLFVQNDPQKRWVNGTRGIVREITPEKIIVEKNNGREVSVEKAMFSLQDAEGNVKASVINFPLILAYATTIHKSQGATLDELWVDLRRLWEPGHAYVAISRLRTGGGLRLLGWEGRSFVIDPQVIQFYEKVKTHNFRESQNAEL